MSNHDKFRVVMRIKPRLENKSQEYEYKVDQNHTITFQDNSQYNLDYIYYTDHENSQEHIYQNEIQTFIPLLLDGINCTTFLYGPSNSGKTYTLLGKQKIHKYGKIDMLHNGLIHLFIQKLFQHIEENQTHEIIFIVYISCIEIYKEQINDLLDQRKCNLKIREKIDKRQINDKIIYVYDLSRHKIQSIHDAYREIQFAVENAHFFGTNLNKRSSRSHCIYMFEIEKINNELNEQTYACMSFIDLAGSEYIRYSHVTQNQLSETQNINKSLSALTMVIRKLSLKALAEKKNHKEKNIHIPYRDSKLTRILSYSLDGNAKCLFILNISSDLIMLPQSVAAARFGKTCKNIKSNAKAQKIHDIQYYKDKLTILERKYKALRRSSINSNSSVPDEEEEKMSKKSKFSESTHYASQTPSPRRNLRKLNRSASNVDRSSSIPLSPQNSPRHSINYETTHNISAENNDQLYVKLLDMFHFDMLSDQKTSQ